MSNYHSLCHIQYLYLWTLEVKWMGHWITMKMYATSTPYQKWGSLLKYVYLVVTLLSMPQFLFQIQTVLSMTGRSRSGLMKTATRQSSVTVYSLTRTPYPPKHLTLARLPALLRTHMLHQASQGHIPRLLLAPLPAQLILNHQQHRRLFQPLGQQ